MQKNAKPKKVSVNRKLIAALTLLVALVLTVIFIFLGVNGRKLDAQGLRKLLPWLPLTNTETGWQQALVPGAGLGETLETAFTADTEGEVAEADLETAAGVLVRRLRDLGWTDVAVRVKDGGLTVTLPKGADTAYLNGILSARGEFTFTDPSGAVFMDGSKVASAAYGYADQTGRNFALSLQFDNEGKKLFGDKSIELLGQSISLLKDGQLMVSPGINEPITQGVVSIPVNSLEEARDSAVLLRSGPLPFGLKAAEAGTSGTALLGGRAQNTLLIALTVVFAVIALYFIITYRLGGLIAAWVLLLQLALSFFFAALLGAGFTLITLAAIHLAFWVVVFALLNLYRGTQDDLRSGRSIRQSVKDSYAGPGHVSLDVFAGLLLISMVIIIADKGVIRLFTEVFALGLLVGLALSHLLLRVLLNETIHLFGAKDALYAATLPSKKEA